MNLIKSHKGISKIQFQTSQQSIDEFQVPFHHIFYLFIKLIAHLQYLKYWNKTESLKDLIESSTFVHYQLVMKQPYSGNKSTKKQQIYLQIVSMFPYIYPQERNIT